MAATVNIKRLTGAAPGTAAAVNIDGTTNRMSTSDNPAPGTASPIPIPAAGTNYSYWVVTQLNAAVGPANGINNMKWYSDGTSFGTGLTCSGNQATSYVQANGTANVTGTVLDTAQTANHYNASGTATSPLLGSPVDVSGLNSGIPNGAVQNIGGSTLTAGGTGYFGNMFVYQLAVGTTATVGTMAARTFTWQYDET